MPATRHMQDDHAGLERPSHRVLVVDDEEDIRTSLKELLQAELGSVDIMTAATGEAALEVIRAHDLDLLVVDYKLPNLDGLDVLARTHERPARIEQGRDGTMGRILITAYADLDIAVQAINRGRIDKIIQKPFEPEEVLDAVRETLHQRPERNLRRMG